MNALLLTAALCVMPDLDRNPTIKVGDVVDDCATSCLVIKGIELSQHSGEVWCWSTVVGKAGVYPEPMTPWTRYCHYDTIKNRLNKPYKRK